MLKELCYILFDESDKAFRIIGPWRLSPLTGFSGPRFILYYECVVNCQDDFTRWHISWQNKCDKELLIVGIIAWISKMHSIYSLHLCGEDLHTLNNFLFLLIWPIYWLRENGFPFARLPDKDSVLPLHQSKTKKGTNKS